LGLLRRFALGALLALVRGVGLALGDHLAGGACVARLAVNFAAATSAADDRLASHGRRPARDWSPAGVMISGLESALGIFLPDSISRHAGQNVPVPRKRREQRRTS
jgi:hypothetical protein